MDEADSPSAAVGGEPGVLGNLPTTRPQHRSSRRGGTATAAATGASGAGSIRPVPRRRPADEPATDEPAATPVPATPAVPAPPSAPRSGWATPEPSPPARTPLPPLVALADGAARTGAQVVRGILRRLPRG